MKILQINKYYYHKGGADTVFLNTIELLEKNGHKVIPFSLKSKKNLPTPYEKYFVDYPELSEISTWEKIKNAPAFFYNQEAALKIEQLIKAEKPDIAHIHLLFNSLSVSILPVLKKYNIPVVMSVHDYRLICPAYTFTNGKGKVCEKCRNEFYFNCAINKCYNNTLLNSILLAADSAFRKYRYTPVKWIDKFLFVSKFSLHKHITFNPAYNSKATHLYNFTSFGKYTKEKKGDYFLYIGRFSREKGIATLIEAARQFPDIKFKLAGTGPLLERYQQNLPSNIELLGYINKKEVNEYIYNAMFVIVPSEWYENNSMSILESEAIGTPIIGSEIGGIPEIVLNNETGYLFKTGSVESLKEVIQKAIEIDEKEYLGMSRKAREFATANFTPEIHYYKLMSIYRSLL